MNDPKKTWLYLQSEPGLWTVGWYEPNDKWHAESDHDSEEKAAARVHYLNGGHACACKETADLAKSLEVILTYLEDGALATAKDRLNSLIGCIRPA